MRSYNDLIKLKTHEERLKYLSDHTIIGEDKFGSKRINNQSFYSSFEWKKLRNAIIARDNGCDLGISGMEIPGRIVIHHIEPLTREDFVIGSERITDPNNLICVSDKTHRMIHYGISNESVETIARSPNDTRLW